MHLPFDSSVRPPGAHAREVLDTTIAGEHVQLMAARALYWPRERTLFVADVHLGKAASFRAGGVPVPRGATATDLGRLADLLATTGAERLAVLGDFLHARNGRVPGLDASFLAWREAHEQVRVTLVRGNHDAKAGDPPAAWGVAVVTEPYPAPPFLLCHTPRTPPTGHVLCGHVHPGIRLFGAGFDTARVPCFVIEAHRTLLPAFGRLTGLADISRTPAQTVVAVAGKHLFTLPPLPV